MFALLPILGGVVLGRFAPRRAAIAVQLLLVVVATAVLTLTAPDHGGRHADVFLFAPALAVVSAVTLAAGMLLRRRAA